MASNTVTIDATYLDTLLRRAQFHSGGPPVDHVTISNLEHESLLEISRQYANLKRNLYRGGIEEATLAILIKDDSENTATENILPGYSSSTDEPFFTPEKPPIPKPSGKSFTFGGNRHNPPRPVMQDYTNYQDFNHGYHNNSHGVDHYYSPEGNDDYFEEEENVNFESQKQARVPRQQFAKFAKRSVLLANLPEGATHAEVVEAVKGGMLLDIYLRANDRTVSISFLEEAAAQDFFRHVKRHDLYIRGKRVEIRWNDRQFILPGHVANKIAIGATRNLVIYNRGLAHTEETIREDLDHIHNLVVVDIRFRGKDAMISLNSVHNAMFARTCMMSRSTYKGYKIEWASDECAASLDTPPQSRKNSAAPIKKKDNSNIVNRFHLLNMDDENGSDEDEQDVSGLS